MVNAAASTARRIRRYARSTTQHSRHPTKEDPPGFETVRTLTVRDFFRQYDEVARDAMKRRSLETYRGIARKHLLPALGTIKLKDLDRERVQRMYSRKRDAGLFPARIRRIHSVLSSALNTAVRCRYIERNVCQEVSPPRVTPTGDTTIQQRRGKEVHSRSGGGPFPCPVRARTHERCEMGRTDGAYVGPPRLGQSHHAHSPDVGKG
jgi:hypothetical protein